MQYTICPVHQEYSKVKFKTVSVQVNFKDNTSVKTKQIQFILPINETMTTACFKETDKLLIGIAKNTCVK